MSAALVRFRPRLNESARKSGEVPSEYPPGSHAPESAAFSTFRRRRLIERFDEASPRVLSLDVFDTLLHRPFEHPTHLFAEIPRHLATVTGRATSVPAPLFRRLRIAAEERARASQPSGEVTIAEICQNLSEALGHDPAATDLMSAEVAVEASFIQLDEDVAALIRHAATKGVPYVLVSDMYLRADDILELLEAAIASSRSSSALPRPAKVFVSGEHRTNKASSMFDTVLQELQCEAGELFHVGDNLHADVESPRKRGIPTFHHFRDTTHGDRVLAAEAKYLSHTLAGTNDHGLRTVRTKLLAAAQAHRHDSPRHFHYGAFIFGPILANFAEWVVADCVRTGQNVVFCLMREGHLLAPLIEKAAAAVSAKIEVRQLWASRYAFRAASYRHGNEPEIRDYLLKRRSVAIDTIARDLALDASVLRKRTGITHGNPLDPQEERALIDAIVSSNELRTQMIDGSSAKRRRLLNYFDEVGVFDRSRMTLVDLGWGGTTQRSLTQVLRDRPRPEHIRGLYLATQEAILNLPADMCSAEGFLVNAGNPADIIATVLRTPEILEHSCMPEDGSFSGIDEQGELTRFPQLIAPQQLREIREMQLGILHFADMWLAGSPQRRKQMSNADHAAMLGRLRAILMRSLQHPTLEEVSLFASWEHDANDGSSECEPFLGSEEIRNRARSMTYQEINALSWLDCYWPQGLATLLGKSEHEERKFELSVPFFKRVLGRLNPFR